MGKRQNPYLPFVLLPEDFNSVDFGEEVRFYYKGEKDMCFKARQILLLEMDDEYVRGVCADACDGVPRMFRKDRIARPGYYKAAVYNLEGLHPVLVNPEGVHIIGCELPTNLGDASIVLGERIEM